MPEYRVTINGFWCRNGSWDTWPPKDGDGDEILLDVNTKIARSDGSVQLNLDSQSELMGDTRNLPNRIRAGSANPLGGIITGDKFPPVANPWRRAGGIDAGRYPPYTIWKGELRPGQDMVILTVTCWEYDPDPGFFNGWLDWQVKTDKEYGQRAKEIFGGIWPVSKPIFDAVSLGIQTAGTLVGLWSPLGSPGLRPIGMQRNPADPDGFLFNPRSIALNTATADYLIANDVQGLGPGIVELLYRDDPYLRGVYSVFVQVERLGGGELPVQSDWRWCDKCQGLYFGGGRATSRCPAGDTHRAAAESRSGDYSLPMDAPAAADRQSGWRWCDRCQGMFFGPGVVNSHCPAGGAHADPGQSGSSDYSPYHNAAQDPGRQSDWRWCDKCQGLFFGPGAPNSRCPAGDTHRLPELSRSGDYSLPHQPAA
ncbi:hypothetical protein [Streptomyces spectabilis]|uniref:Uncharacterized protein n=1 Tax=Streptomyces spectabilis TaxID=68270 RepID=A0A516R189_STRST|nr:hypothetical protein [Streptomyces spectabilis]QDQ09412.1 hypothetical protein FH965_01540 [Streptomyces spectabilis]